MKQPDFKILDDLARVAGGAMNVFSGLREQILSDVKLRFDELAARMDLVPRDDFERLVERVNALQKQVDALSGSKKTQKAADKPAASKSAKAGKTKPAKKPGKKK